MNPPRVRLHDIAAVCGVSTSTVSYVLAGKAHDRGLSAETVSRVSAVAADLGYVRNRSARALRRGETNTVLFFYEPPMDRFVERYILRAAPLLKRKGYQLLAVPVVANDASIITEALGSGVCDAGILGVSRSCCEQLFAAVSRPPVPTFVLGALDEDPQTYDLVCYDEEEALTEALERAVSQDGVRVAMAAQESSAQEAVRTSRWRAYEAFQRARGQEPDLLLHAGADIPASFAAAMKVLAQRRDQNRLPEVIYCGADRVAIGVTMAAQQLSISVPETLGVIGTGNSSEALAYERPLTSVGLSDESIDAVIAQLLARLADGTSQATATTERWRLFSRQTTRN